MKVVLAFISIALLVLMVMSFLLAAYHFVRLMGCFKSNSKEVAASLLSPFSIFSSIFWTEQGNKHRHLFFRYMVLFLLGGGLILIGKFVVEYIRGY